MPKISYYCDNLKCRNHILVTITVYPAYTEYKGGFQTFIEDNHEYKTEEGETLNFCTTCKGAIDIIKGDL